MDDNWRTFEVEYFDWQERRAASFVTEGHVDAAEIHVEMTPFHVNNRFASVVEQFIGRHDVEKKISVRVPGRTKGVGQVWVRLKVHYFERLFAYNLTDS